jgi:hypothetical protein
MQISSVDLAWVKSSSVVNGRGDSFGVVNVLGWPES